MGWHDTIATEVHANFLQGMSLDIRIPNLSNVQLVILLVEKPSEKSLLWCFSETLSGTTSGVRIFILDSAGVFSLRHEQHNLVVPEART